MKYLKYLMVLAVAVAGLLIGNPAQAADFEQVSKKDAKIMAQYDDEHRPVSFWRTCEVKHGKVYTTVRCPDGFRYKDWTNGPVKKYPSPVKSAPPCIYEDGSTQRSCVWVAVDRVNGIGRSFVMVKRNGKRTYDFMSHRKAQRIVGRWTKENCLPMTPDDDGYPYTSCQGWKG